MFGADVVVGSLWDLHRNGIAPYLDRIGLDDFSRAYQDVRFELVAVGTRSEASARRAEREMAAATGGTVRGYWGETPWEDILRDYPDLDVMLVSTPDHLHTAPALAALRRGVHVIVEKPMCLDVHEADEIIREAEARNLIVGADMHKRYDPDHLRIFEDLAPATRPTTLRPWRARRAARSRYRHLQVGRGQRSRSPTSASTGSTSSCTSSG